MSRKHNTRHERNRSHYTDRLARRGQSPSGVRMEDLDTLRARQQRRIAASVSPFWVSDLGQNGGQS